MEFFTKLFRPKQRRKMLRRRKKRKTRKNMRRGRGTADEKRRTGSPVLPQPKLSRSLAKQIKSGSRGRLPMPLLTRQQASTVTGSLPMPTLTRQQASTVRQSPVTRRQRSPVTAVRTKDVEPARPKSLSPRKPSPTRRKVRKFIPSERRLINLPLRSPVKRY